MNKIDIDLEERLLNYSTAIIELVDTLPNTRSGNHIGGQLLRSGHLRFQTMAKPRRPSRGMIFCIKCKSA